MILLPEDVQEAIRATPIEHPGRPCADELAAIGAMVGDCHRNAAAWVAAHPGARIVPGWLIAAQCFVVRHSNVETDDGRLLDVTPREKGTSSRTFQFVRWQGTDEEFRSMPVEGWYIPAGGVPLPDVRLENS